MSDKLLRVPVKARTLGLPVGGTIITAMLPRVFPELRGWQMGVIVTLMVILWIVSIIDVFTANNIPDAVWQERFGEDKP